MTDPTVTVVYPGDHQSLLSPYSGPCPRPTSQFIAPGDHDWVLNEVGDGEQVWYCRYCRRTEHFTFTAPDSPRKEPPNDAT